MTIWLALWMLGCASESFQSDSPNDTDNLADTANPEGSDLPDVPTVPGGFLLDVEPPAGGRDDLLPHSFGPYREGSGFQLLLRPSVVARGTVTAEEITGFGVAELPRREVPVAGVLTFTQIGTMEERLAVPGADGRYRLDLIPGAYTIRVVPDDPRLPVLTRSDLILEDRRVDLAAGTGVPLWGRLRDAAGTPLPGAPVWAMAPSGLTTSQAITDDGGWFEIRVPAGVWALSTSGPPGGREPVLTLSGIEVGDLGARADIEYRDTVRSVLSVRFVGSRGEGVSGLTVQLTSQSIRGYEFDGRFELRGVTDDRGFLDARVPAGTYTLETLPVAGDSLAPLRLADVDLTTDVDLDAVDVAGVITTAIPVEDDAGAPLGDAPVVCTEQLGRQRLFSGATDGFGVLALDVPDTRLICVVQPPPGRDDLAPLRAVVAAPTDAAPLVLDAGVVLSGRVAVLDGNTDGPLAGAIVRVRDTSGVALGFGLAGAEGEFSLRLPRFDEP